MSKSDDNWKKANKINQHKLLANKTGFSWPPNKFLTNRILYHYTKNLRWKISAPRCGRRKKETDERSNGNCKRTLRALCRSLLFCPAYGWHQCQCVAPAKVKTKSILLFSEFCSSYSAIGFAILLQTSDFSHNNVKRIACWHCWSMDGWEKGLFLQSKLCTIETARFRTQTRPNSSCFFAFDILPNYVFVCLFCCTHTSTVVHGCQQPTSWLLC